MKQAILYKDASRRRVFFAICTLLLIVIVSGLFAAWIQRKTDAAPVTGFNAGNIMTDEVMRNKGTMNTSRIQAFLNAKGSNCTSGSNCLKNYRQNGKSAAQIIFETSQKYNINPQVLIVLLQKEVGIVTMNNPESWRYRTATGYGCPDSTPGVCNSSYYGFSNQLKWAATMFDAILRNSPTWYAPYTVGKNDILLHPHNNCGTQRVNIQNRATAALYSYTPYVPNKAALNAGYGTGDRCSSYGNRNFYKYFTDWFGSTTGSYFFKISGSSREYILGSDNTYYYIPTPEIKTAYGWGRTINKVMTYNKSYLNGKTYKGHLKPLARFEGDAIYLIDSSYRFHFTRSTLNRYGFEIGQESLLPSYLETSFRDRGSMQSVAEITDGSGTIYFVENGKKRHFSGPSAYRSGSPAYSSLPKMGLSYGILRTLPEISSIYAEGSLVRINSSATVYVINSENQKIPVPNRDVMSAYGYKFSNVKNVSSSQIAAYQTAPSGLSSIVKDSGTYVYLITNSGKRHKVPENMYAHFGINTASLQQLSNPHLKRFTAAKDLTRVIKAINNNDVYHVTNGKKQRVASPSKLRELGFTSADVTTVSSSYLKSIPNS